MHAHMYRGRQDCQRADHSKFLLGGEYFSVLFDFFIKNRYKTKYLVLEEGCGLQEPRAKKRALLEKVST